MIAWNLKATLTRLVASVVPALVCSVAFAAGAFYEKDGAEIRGFDPVAYFTDGKAVKGTPEYQAVYKGSTFHFRSPSNRDAFAADPAKYAPQYDGYCAFGTAGGYKAATHPSAFTIVASKLYLNYNQDVQKKWSSDIPGYVKSADGKLPEVAKHSKVIE